jgi:hypothetical protein
MTLKFTNSIGHSRAVLTSLRNERTNLEEIERIQQMANLNRHSMSPPSKGAHVKEILTTNERHVEGLARGNLHLSKSTLDRFNSWQLW